MSAPFDTMSRVFDEHIRPHVPDPMLAELFSQLIHTVHNANHRVPSADGVFKGDGVAKDRSVYVAARELADHIERTLPRCEFCERPAVCVGKYEGQATETRACDRCCVHGNEDGHCTPIPGARRGRC